MIEKLTTKVSINTRGEAIRFANECYEVAEDFAIGFTEWLIENKILSSKMPVKELLEIYKKSL
jgi:hypothetical protein